MKTESFTFVLVSKLVLAFVDLWDVFFHVLFTGLLVFPERWNSSCSSFKGLITSRRSSAPLYEIARKAEQAEWQQKQPAYSKARDLEGTISLPSHTTKKKKDQRVTPKLRNHTCARSCVHAHVHKQLHPLLTCGKKRLHKGHLMQHCITSGEPRADHADKRHPPHLLISHTEKRLYTTLDFRCSVHKSDGM